MTSTYENIRNIINVSKSKYNRYIERFDHDEERLVNHFISKRNTIPTQDELNNVLDNIAIQTVRGQLKVESSKFDVSIHNFLANVSIDLEFENSFNQALEANLVFHCENSVVTSFTVELNGKKIESVCKTKKEAKEEYDDRISEGHFVSVQKKVSRDSFSVLLGNVKSFEKGKLTINYITELESDDRNAVFKMPSILSPSESSYNGNISVNMLSEISNIIPETNNPDNYEIKKKNGNEALIKVKSKGKEPIHIEFEFDNPKESDYIIEKSKTFDNDALMVSFSPEPSLFEDDSSLESNCSSEIIFIVDRSGSMSGSRIRQARDALQIFMRSLPVGSYFNIISFGSTFRKMFKKSVLYDDKSLSDASQQIEVFDSNMGGTDILSPLSHALTMESPSEDGSSIPRQIFLLTDGEDSNHSGILNTVKKSMKKSTRIFTFGIGASASKTLVNGIAKFGRGIAEFVNSDDSIESSVIFLLNESLKGFISDINIEFSNIDHDYSNIKIQYPVLFSGERIYSYALLSNKNNNDNKDSKVILRGKIGSKDIKIECPINFNDKSRYIKNDIVHKAAANMIINSLENEDSKANKQSIIDIGMKYSISSKYTQFVAVIERENEEAQELHSVDIKVTDSNDNNDEYISQNYPSLQYKQPSYNRQISRSVKKKKGGFGGGSGGGFMKFFKSVFSSSSESSKKESIDDYDECDDDGTLNSGYSFGRGYDSGYDAQLCSMEEFSSPLPPPHPSTAPVYSPPPPPTTVSYSSMTPSSPSPQIQRSIPMRKTYLQKEKKISTPTSYSSTSSSKSSSPLVQLLSKADTFGMYKLDESLANLIDLSVEKIKNSIPSSLKDDIDLWISIIVLVVLELKYGKERSKWKLSGNKTLKVVNDKLKKLGVNLDELKESAKSLF